VPLDGFQKYYKVAASYQGGPENLAEIADRFLGGSGRSPEIFDLNAGRRQPDGGALTDPNKLHAGWYVGTAVGRLRRRGAVRPAPLISAGSAGRHNQPDATVERRE
jgi:hypothetical protein